MTTIVLDKYTNIYKYSLRSIRRVFGDNEFDLFLDSHEFWFLGEKMNIANLKAELTYWKTPGKGGVSGRLYASNDNDYRAKIGVYCEYVEWMNRLYIAQGILRSDCPSILKYYGVNCGNNAISALFKVGTGIYNIYSLRVDGSESKKGFSFITKEVLVEHIAKENPLFKDMVEQVHNLEQEINTETQADIKQCLQRQKEVLENKLYRPFDQYMKRKPLPQGDLPIFYADVCRKMESRSIRDASLDTL